MTSPKCPHCGAVYDGPHRHEDCVARLVVRLEGALTILRGVAEERALYESQSIPGFFSENPTSWARRAREFLETLEKP